MLNVRIEGDKFVIKDLDGLAIDITGAISRGLERAAKGLLRTAYSFLSGPANPVGEYPVPVQTGHLRRMMDWLKPGETKQAEFGSIGAALDEAVIYNSASYHAAIHEGIGSSKKFGPRRFMTDALDRFNASGTIEQILQQEVQKDIDKRGMA